MLSFLFFFSSFSFLTLLVFIMAYWERTSCIPLSRLAQSIEWNSRSTLKPDCTPFRSYIINDTMIFITYKLEK